MFIEQQHLYLQFIVLYIYIHKHITHISLTILQMLYYDFTFIIKTKNIKHKENKV